MTPIFPKSISMSYIYIGRPISISNIRVPISNVRYTILESARAKARARAGISEG